MTGSDDSYSTRPISVAELLAKNGTIGSPPVGGRRRRRRGNADAVTVAELTGEIPIVRPDEPAPVEEQPGEPEPEPEQATPTNGTVDEATSVEPDGELVEPAEDTVTAEDENGETEPEAESAIEAEPELEDDEYAKAVAEYAAHMEQRGTEPEETAEPARRFGFGRFGRKSSTVDAEQWTPDPVDEDTLDSDVEIDTDEDLTETEIEDLDDELALRDTHDTLIGADVEIEDEDEDEDVDELPSYLRSTEEPLFGGQTVADDLARRGRRPTEEHDEDEDEDVTDEAYGEPRRMSSFVHGLWIVGQCIIAVIFGAGLFVAFDQLWKWNNIIALVLSVLVILGLVVGVRVVRKTEDIGSTLIAVAVGALVTLGPLALLQSG
ncbi:hypothetical protein [Mycolicibacterium sp.]|uniref:hypothetical protein n=1 Tax=Mycolicibacterium sp. TaxID=2320850 RepID=UPI003D0E7F66